MSSFANPPNIDDLNKKLTKDEDWLREFDTNLKKSEHVSTNVTRILNVFSQQVDDLKSNVAPLCSKTATIQKKQQNVKKLLGITEASIQFYGKTSGFESAIRRGTTNLNLEEYIELMNGLKDAIKFFGSHSSYRGQLEAMKESFENGCGFLETEFNNCVRFESTVLDVIKNSIISAAKFDYIQRYEQSRITWSLFATRNTNCLQYLKYFVNYRAENMLKTTRLVNDQMRGFIQQKTTKTQFLKTALKKATGRGNERQFEDAWGESSITVATILLSVLLALVQIETEVCAKIFASVEIEAQLLRKIASEPLRECLERGLAAVEQFNANFVSMLPLARFLTLRSNQLSTLSQNVGHADLFNNFSQKAISKSSKLISDFIDHLTNEHTRFVPEDGTVHAIASNTMNFLKILTKYQSVVNFVLENNPKSESKLSKIFAQIMTALGVNLRNKSASYADQHLAALFMFNNLTYVQQCLREESVAKLVREQNPQFFANNQKDIDNYLKKYLQSWQRVTNVLMDGSGLDRSAKTRYANFNKEFDYLIESQKLYSVLDVENAQAIRQQIKRLVLKPYVEFATKNSQEAYNFNLDRQLKYDAESIEIIIDRLFDVTY
ncbi:Exocyst complex component 7 [Aphelenchoides bicaudatus]|nr:Exocyst complex component 7 [Aphelenchoides bicaudatus]